MRLSELEKKMLAGEMGEPRRLALEEQMQVGRAFDAEDFVEVSQAHVMCDTESLGDTGVEYLERLAEAPEKDRRVGVPTLTDPRGLDLCAYKELKQPEAFAERERRTIRALRSMGVLMTNTCINYQTIMPPVHGESLAFGDTGAVIYVNSVLGARSNFEGGPAALSAALTGRVPRYGCHLDERRKGTDVYHLEWQPTSLSDWGALGAVVGQRVGSYWRVPVMTGVQKAPTSDALKHFGAALASYGSVPLYHMVGITPEAPTLEAACGPGAEYWEPIRESDIRAFYQSFGRHTDQVDVVVFAAPQLSLMELQRVAELLDGERVHPDTALMIATSPENYTACERMGLVDVFEHAGAKLLRGVCFYQMYARELGEANGWQRLMSNSAKLVNIISGYGYEPAIGTTEECVEAALTGRMPE